MKFAEQIQVLRRQAQAAQHRRLVVFCGGATWCRQQAILQTQQADTVWLGKTAPEGVESVAPKQAQGLLGRTVQQLVVNAWDGLNPDALGQAAGALTGGGLLLLLCPPFSQWLTFDDPEYRAMVTSPDGTHKVGHYFLWRLIELLRADEHALIIEESATGQQTTNDVQTGDSAIDNAQAFAMPSLDDAAIDTVVAPVPTIDQQRAVQAILNTARNRRQPLVITADRGRGKSAALGMAAAELLQQQRTVLVSAPGYQASREVFKFAQHLLPDAVTETGLLRWQQGVLRYVEPEQLLSEPLDGVVVLVDEAAAIPAPVLVAILERFNRVVFSTTVHGYEGTGRGFAVRFRQQLEQKAPRWRSIRLSQPVRWAADDPLEALLFNVLLLNAEAAEDQVITALPDRQGPSRVERLTSQQLVADEALLRQLFGLLVQAHYRTTPGDLRLLLDSPALSVWCIRQQQQVLACALVADEGPLPAELAEPVWAGHRRPPGHLMPQALVAQAGFLDAAPLRCARIMRIAVHAQCRRQQLGAALLQGIAEDAGKRQLDYLGASFAATADILPFWLNAQCLPVRIGSQRDSVSGAHAMLVMRPLSPAAQTLFDTLRQRYSAQLPWLLQHRLTSLEPELLVAMLQKAELPVLDAQDVSDLRGFALYNRTLESSRYALQKFVLLLFQRRLLPESEEQQQQLIAQLTVSVEGRKSLLHKADLQQFRHLIAGLLCQAQLDKRA